MYSLSRIRKLCENWKCATTETEHYGETVWWIVVQVTYLRIGPVPPRHLWWVFKWHGFRLSYLEAAEIGGLSTQGRAPQDSCWWADLRAKKIIFPFLDWDWKGHHYTSGAQWLVLIWKFPWHWCLVMVWVCSRSSNCHDFAFEDELRKLATQIIWNK